MVGSSRNRMEGEEISAQAMFRRRFSPPDSPRTKMPPGSAPPTCSRAFLGSLTVPAVLSQGTCQPRLGMPPVRVTA